MARKRSGCWKAVVNPCSMFGTAKKAEPESTPQVRAHEAATGAPVSDPAGIEKHPETRRIGDRRSAVASEDAPPLCHKNAVSS